MHGPAEFIRTHCLICNVIEAALPLRHHVAPKAERIKVGVLCHRERALLSKRTQTNAALRYAASHNHVLPSNNSSQRPASTRRAFRTIIIISTLHKVGIESAGG